MRKKPSATVDSPDSSGAVLRRDRSGRGLSLSASLGVVGLTVGVFVASIWLLTGPLRTRLHEAILSVDGEIFAAAIETSLTENPQIDSKQDLLGRVWLATNFRENEVFAFRIFDVYGNYVIGRPKNIRPADLDKHLVETVGAGKVAGKFEPTVALKEVFPGGEGSTPLFRSTVPISMAGEVIGAAQFLLEGRRIQERLAKVDRDVNRYAIWFSIVGGLLIAWGLSWAFYRLNHANALLAARTKDLQRANEELTLAAKTSALGAVTAHLIHGLKNPLFGLQAFVSGEFVERGEQQWNIAAETTRRMQAMIADVVRILQEEESPEGAYEVSVPDLAQMLRGKLTPTAKESSIQLAFEARSNATLPNREANLIVLALTNLMQNAMQASKAGSQVRLEAFETETAICFRVSDEAGGLPGSALKNLFVPCQSSKAGGTGLGLAITKQLANHMGGQLELVETNSKGTTFQLSIPRSLCVGNVEADGVKHTAGALP